MLFTNANLFLDGCFQRGAFRVENGRFAKILTDAAGDGIDLHGQYVIPGLVDIHNHGNSGADFSDGDYDGLVKMAKYLAANGVTSFAPASMTLPYDVLEAAYKTAAALKKAAPEGCARLMGINMEGPFFSEKKKGAQNASYLRLPDYAAFERLYNASEGLLRIADIAAELPSAVEFTEKASKLCTVSIAHTDCTYEEASAVFDAGASHLTHLYNAMPGIHHRKPGPIGAGSERENVVAELISDGYHIHPSAVRMAGYLQAALGLLMETAPPRGGEALTVYARQGAAFLQQNYSRSIGVEEAARQAGVSRSCLYRAFQAEFGCSPSAYLIRYRIQRATQLLRHSTLPISAVAASVGFEDPLYFSRAFRRAVGQSPTEYRQQNGPRSG